jgi:hypothetical protein
MDFFKEGLTSSREKGHFTGGFLYFLVGSCFFAISRAVPVISWWIP